MCSTVKWARAWASCSACTRACRRGSPRRAAEGAGGVGFDRLGWNALARGLALSDETETVGDFTEGGREGLGGTENLGQGSGAGSDDRPAGRDGVHAARTEGV